MFLHCKTQGWANPGLQLDNAFGVESSALLGLSFALFEFRIVVSKTVFAFRLRKPNLALLLSVSHQGLQQPFAFESSTQGTHVLTCDRLSRIMRGLSF